MPPTVLVVDHIADLREIYRTALETAGYAVVDAMLPEQLIAAVRRSLEK
jgi:hypothetical protein